MCLFLFLRLKLNSSIFNTKILRQIILIIVKLECVISFYQDLLELEYIFPYFISS
jgi:hypothetical protein